MLAPLPPQLARLALPQQRFESLREQALLRRGGRLFDLAYANSHDGPAPEVTEAIAGALATPRALDLQYTPYGGATVTRRLVANALGPIAGRRVPWRQVILTPGAMAALNILFRCVRREGQTDEALVLVPGWLDYPLYLEHLGFRVKFVPTDPRTLRLDLEQIRRALTPNTRLLVLSQPANPSGLLYSAEELQALAALLNAAPDPPLLISDECHRDVRFDDQPFVSPAEFYDATCIAYSFGKSWFMQGQRIGYVAVSPRMPAAQTWVERLEAWCRIMGYCTPTALMQLAVRSLLGRRPDLTRITARRDRAIQQLRAAGYDLIASQATFFLYPRTPDGWVGRLGLHRTAGGGRGPGVARAAVPSPGILPPVLDLHGRGAGCGAGRAGQQPGRERAGPGVMIPLAQPTPVSDFLWLEGSRLPAAPARLSAADCQGLSGQFALHLREDGGTHLLARDRLGVNKLFFAIDSAGASAGTVDSSNYLKTLISRGHRAGDIWSVPSGHVLRIDPARRQYQLEKLLGLAYGSDSHNGPDDGQGVPPALDRHVQGIRQALTSTFSRLAEALRGRRIYVTMSGGLDSSVIAVMAREYLGDFVGLTFAMDGGAGAPASGEDLYHADHLARRLGVPLEVITVAPDQLVELLDPVLVYGQDWRDFNVHCGLVNAVIARHLQRQDSLKVGAQDTSRPVLLTGDTMNELLADYCPVMYRGVEYYSLPRLPIGRLRRFLVAGLDSGDREIGIFNAFGLDAIQPYALCAEAYAALPAALLEGALTKQTLVRQVMGDRIPPAIYDRPKVRAQVGSSTEVGGTLAALADRGLHGARLRERFSLLHGMDEPDTAALIRGGFYRFSSTYPERRM